MERPLPNRARAVAIGNFDGVHRGHQLVLATLAAEARRLGVEPAVLTFSPHPRLVLGRPVPPLLTTLARKEELVRRVDPSIALIVRPFDAELAAKSPEAFAREVLAGELGAKVVAVGRNFRFGRERAGGFDDLTRLGATLGFETRSHDLAGDPDGPWSSSRVRDAIARGDLEDAARMLGRPHRMGGVVVRGDQRGRTLGFPTCNLGGVEEMLPPLGVYAVRVERDGARIAGGVANIGVRPTVDAQASAPRVEVHLFDVALDLYGARLEVELVARLRAEQRFDGLDALKAQIARDAESARAALGKQVS